MTSPLRLRPLRLEDEDAVRAGHREMRALDDFGFALDLTDDETWPDFVDRHERVRFGLELTAHRVPATFLLAEVDGVIVGRASIRHELNDWLTTHGGHVGYGVLPSYRRRGYATEILRQSVIVARSVGVTDVLVLCDEDNVGSRTVIESCGGVRDAQWPTSPPEHPGEQPSRRYWIR